MHCLADKYFGNPKPIAKKLLKRLKRYRPYIHAVSKSRRSVYIHFLNLPGDCTHKLRVSDHNERSNYGYKWQLRLDGLGNIDRKTWSRYFTDIDDLVRDFERYYDMVREKNVI